MPHKTSLTFGGDGIAYPLAVWEKNPIQGATVLPSRNAVGTHDSTGSTCCYYHHMPKHGCFSGGKTCDRLISLPAPKMLMLLCVFPYEITQIHLTFQPPLGLKHSAKSCFEGIIKYGIVTMGIALCQWFPIFFHLCTPWQPISINCTLHFTPVRHFNIDLCFPSVILFQVSLKWLRQPKRVLRILL